MIHPYVNIADLKPLISNKTLLNIAPPLYKAKLEQMQFGCKFVNECRYIQSPKQTKLYNIIRFTCN